MYIKEHLHKRNLLFLACCVAAYFMFYKPLVELTRFSIHSMYYSHIWLIPLVSAFFMVTERKKIFQNVEYSYRSGAPLLIVGIIVYIGSRNLQAKLSLNDYSALTTFSALIFIHGFFLLFYGVQALKTAIFPLLFLIFMVPIPAFLMDKTIHLLLIGSTAVTELLFKITGVPYIRESATFDLPGISIVVAKKCSGIRSSFALVITMVIAAHLFLNTTWKKVILLLMVYPVTVFKNGVRIVTISLLATYVDERFLTHSWLHQSGGFVFFIPSLAFLGLILWLLRRSEKRKAEGPKAEGSGPGQISLSDGRWEDGDNPKNRGVRSSFLTDCKNW